MWGLARTKTLECGLGAVPGVRSNRLRNCSSLGSKPTQEGPDSYLLKLQRSFLTEGISLSPIQWLPFCIEQQEGSRMEDEGGDGDGG